MHRWLSSRHTAGAVALAVITTGFAGATMTSCESLRWSSVNGTPDRAGAERAGPPADLRVGEVRGVAFEPEMRVRIRSGVDTLRVGLARSGAARIAGTTGAAGTIFASPATGSAPRPRPLAAPVTVALRPEGWVLTDGAGAEHTIDRALPLELAPRPPVEGAGDGAGGPDARIAPQPGALLTINDAPHPGRVWLTPRSDVGEGAFDVIERVPLETYLLGVVSKELYKDWPLGAFEAQAVCARTYALHERERKLRSGGAFDVESDESDQAYAGASALPVAVQAIESTRGVVVTWNGGLLRTYYSSTCGGRSASARDIWPIGPGWEFNLAAPIQAHERTCACDDSPRFRWSQTRERTELVRRLRGFGKDAGLTVRDLSDIASIEATEWNAVGRPTRYAVREPGGRTFSLTGEELRRGSNFAVDGLPAITPKTRVSSGDLEAVVDGATVRFSGRGFGHGVGMCQYGIRGMAARGDPWREIVLRFYPGGMLERAY